VSGWRGIIIIFSLFKWGCTDLKKEKSGDPQEHKFFWDTFAMDAEGLWVKKRE